MRDAGLVVGWVSNRVRILFDREHSPAVGDLYYVDSGKRKTVLQLTELNSIMEAYPPTTAPALSATVMESTTISGVAEAFLEVDAEQGAVYTPSSLPRPGSRVRKLDARDPASVEIMKQISGAGRGAPIGVLRAGVAPHPALRDSVYFWDAKVVADLGALVPKHVLVSGQTGAGKTTGVMGIIASAIAAYGKGLGWLVIDRHGDYTRRGPGASFQDVALRAASLAADRPQVTLYRVAHRGSQQAPGYIEGPIDVAGLTVDDVATAAELEERDASNLEEAVDALAMALDQACDKFKLPQAVCSQFLLVDEGGAPRPTGNTIALLALVYENMAREEAAKAKRDEKYGFHSFFLARGISSIATLRRLKRVVAEALGLRIRPSSFSPDGRARSVYVADDSRSPFKVVSTLKEPEPLASLLLALAAALKELGYAPLASYRFGSLEHHAPPAWALEALKRHGPRPSGVALEEIVGLAEGGNAVVVDVSPLPPFMGDSVALALARRLLERRMAMGPDEASRRPPVGIVSEEAPLYLSSERVKSVYNPFARIAREGRKFNVGLVAITQMATAIDRQILANFNTVVAMRTNYAADLDFYSGLGVPREAPPFLADREAFVYSPDLHVKKPLPVYVPGFFELKLGGEGGELRAPRELLEGLGGGG